LANLFMMFAPLEGWRHVKVTDRHTAMDYARVFQEAPKWRDARARPDHDHRLSKPDS
jgi:hypothetical protein